MLYTDHIVHQKAQISPIIKIVLSYKMLGKYVAKVNNTSDEFLKKVDPIINFGT